MRDRLSFDLLGHGVPFVGSRFPVLDHPGLQLPLHAHVQVRRAFLSRAGSDSASDDFR